MKRKRTLYVKVTDFHEISRRWGNNLALMLPNSLDSFLYFIQCTKEGKINWDRNSIYTIQELIERNNVKIIN